MYKIGWRRRFIVRSPVSKQIFFEILFERIFVWIRNCPNSQLSEFETVRIRNCPNSKLSELKVVQNSKLSELEIVRIRNCPNQTLESTFLLNFLMSSISRTRRSDFIPDLASRSLGRNSVHWNVTPRVTFCVDFGATSFPRVDDDDDVMMPEVLASMGRRRASFIAGVETTTVGMPRILKWDNHISSKISPQLVKA